MSGGRSSKDEATNGLHVIGCGLPRTGTLSTKTALEMILPGKCHHMVTAFQHQEQWRDILSGKADDQEFADFFCQNGYTAAVDGPFCFYYKRALKLFPNAKVLLNVRDPERWSKSVKETIVVSHAMPFPVNIFNYLRLFNSYLILYPTLLAAIQSSPQNRDFLGKVKTDNGVAFYNAWVSEVERSVPPEQLLKFNVKDGWEPLCHFLGVPIPDAPFPNVNKRGMFVERAGLQRRRAWLLLYEMTTLPLWCYFLYKFA